MIALFGGLLAMGVFLGIGEFIRFVLAPLMFRVHDADCVSCTRCAEKSRQSRTDGLLFFLLLGAFVVIAYLAAA